MAVVVVVVVVVVIIIVFVVVVSTLSLYPLPLFYHRSPPRYPLISISDMC